MIPLIIPILVLIIPISIVISVRHYQTKSLPENITKDWMDPVYRCKECGSNTYYGSPYQTIKHDNWCTTGAEIEEERFSKMKEIERIKEYYREKDD